MTRSYRASEFVVLSLMAQIGGIAAFALLVVLVASTSHARESGKRPIANPNATPMAMSEGVEGLLRGLSDRERDLTRKEREMGEREQSIASLEEQVELRLLEIEAIRAAVEKRIEAWYAKEGDRVARLAKVYAAMPAEKSAPLLQKLEQDLATAILGKMKDKVSAAVLAAMPRAEALRLSRRLAHPLDVPRGKKR